MKNEQEIKALFFAQYLGQEVYTVSGWEHTKCLKVDGVILQRKYISDGFLLLRSVNQLTDAEKIIVAGMCYINIEATKGHGIYHDPYFSLDENYIEINVTSSDDTYYPIAHTSYQYLLRIGILLPFTFIDDTGHPQTLSTEDIIARKWVQIVKP